MIAFVTLVFPVDLDVFWARLKLVGKYVVHVSIKIIKL